MNRDTTKEDLSKDQSIVTPSMHNNNFRKFSMPYVDSSFTQNSDADLRNRNQSVISVARTLQFEPLNERPVKMGSPIYKK